ILQLGSVDQGAWLRPHPSRTICPILVTGVRVPITAWNVPTGGREMLTGTVDCDGFQLAWVRKGRGIPMLVLGASRFYPRYFPSAMRDSFDMVFCNLRQWVPTPDGFDIAAITCDT